MSANTYGLDFLSFTISDYDSKKIIFQVGKDMPAPQDVSVDFSATGEDMYRKIRYNFSEDVLRLPFIQTSLYFAVGPLPIENFRMIERIYFRDQLIKSFDFEFGFCIPSSKNTWEAVYPLPLMTEALISEMIDNPWETRSDSFYFVNNRLVMHNKAAYKYFREDAAQEKKSYEDKYGDKGSKTAAKASTKSIAGSKVETYLDDSAEAKVAVGGADSKEPSPRAPLSSKVIIYCHQKISYLIYYSPLRDLYSGRKGRCVVKGR